MNYKIKYYDCQTSGNGLCYYCESPTNYILDTLKGESFVCFSCVLSHCKSPKIRRKAQRYQKARINENSRTSRMKIEKEQSKIKEQS